MIIILLLLFTSALGNEDKILGMSEANSASSCNEIYLVGELLASTG